LFFVVFLVATKKKGILELVGCCFEKGEALVWFFVGDDAGVDV